MKLREVIEAYEPYNEQEKKDKEIFLKYINTFDDVLTRKNEFAHFTSSAFVINKSKDKVLMIYHNIYDSWNWPGGHADGESDLFKVAIKELEEETGIKRVVSIMNEILSIDTLPSLGHFKRNKYVSAHTDLSVSYLIEADENEPIRVKEDENSDVKWIPIEMVTKKCTLQYMKPVYEKIIEKIKML